MDNNFSETSYQEMLDKLFHRFPSFQKAGATAYKPGIGNMLAIDEIAGHPHRKYRIIHIAGTNGKGSVSNILASVLSASGLRTGLYTSPHILDFRERMRIASPDGSIEYISKEYVWDFIHLRGEDFNRLDLSFFEITTIMALCWFADRKVDAVVLETGLGGRLDSTNIVNPQLSVITNIGLDHCDLLGNTLAEIAAEKAGIIKPGVPVVVGESSPETDPVFRANSLDSRLLFADQVLPSLWDKADDILDAMDLQGCYQRKNLRTALAAIDVLRSCFADCDFSDSVVEDAIIHTASRMDFHGRWEKVSDNPWIICDIGHNEHGLKYNFAQLETMLSEGKCSHLIIVYGSVSDKDVDSVMHLMPRNATYIFTNASSRRAMPASEVLAKYLNHCRADAVAEVHAVAAVSVPEALRRALDINAALLAENPQARPLIYVGGSTYVVSEAVACLHK